MKIFLTSSTGRCYKENGKYIACELDAKNGFIRLLKDCWPKDCRLLILSADPCNDAVNDSLLSIIPQSFVHSGLPVAGAGIVDGRNADSIGMSLKEADVIVLSGGHVPTQNSFFHKIGLRELLSGYQGILIGISAGTMNCAELVYAQPELDGEAVDPGYHRYLKGLGLTSLNILPHFQYIREQKLDGLRILEDLSLPDSYVHPIYGLPDGSFLLLENETATLYGEAWLLNRGEISVICGEGKTLRLDSL